MPAARKPADQPGFITTQTRFAAHIRDPEGSPPPPDVEARRMKIYSDLFFNNVEDFMANAFPVLKQISPDDHWQTMMRDYFARHRSHTPLFPEMPREFLKYLESERQPDPADFPFMLELAHYEWVELALSISEQETQLAHIDPEGDLLTGTPVLSPLAWPLCYHYPVHRIGPDFLPEAAEDHPSYLVVYRDNDDEVHFLEINPVTAQLLDLISTQQKLTGREILLTIAQQLQHPDPEAVVKGGLDILQDMQQRGIVLGVNKA